MEAASDPPPPVRPSFSWDGHFISHKAPLTGLKIQISGKAAADFVSKKPQISTLPPGGTTSFKIQFKPMTMGSKSAKLQVFRNDPDESPFDLKLTGKGLP